MMVTRNISRRNALKSGALLAAGLSLLSRSRQTVAQEALGDNALRDQLLRTAGDSSRRVIIKGGTILTMDPMGPLLRSDVLIEGRHIAQVGPNFASAASNALVIDAANAIVMPGFVDPHIHSWQGQLAGLIPNSNGVADDRTHNYFSVMHQTFGPHYRPQDMYIGNLLTALSCLDAGITCFCDNSHNSRSAAHADEAVRALKESGARAVYASGGIRFPEQQWDRQWPEDVRRIRREHFSSDDQLVTLRMYSGIDDANLKVARELDLWVTFDGGSASPRLPELYANKTLVGRESFNHGGGVPDENWKVIRDNGAKVNVCPRSDIQFGFGGPGRGLHAVQDALDHGIRPGISNDNPSAYAVDMFAEMQVLYFTQRSMAQLARFNKAASVPAGITARDVLEFATIRGAECCALERVCGTLTPGKEADLVILRAPAMRMQAVNNVYGAVVQGGNIRDVDTVFVAGQLKKWRGALVGHDLARVRRLAEDSRQHLLMASGWEFDPASD
jgi:5-methylthioadenosine/S-adenosylhomocysteine deaminase